MGEPYYCVGKDLIYVYRVVNVGDKDSLSDNFSK